MEKLSFYDLNKILEQIADSRSSDFEMDAFLDSDNSRETGLWSMVSAKFHPEADIVGNFELVQDNVTELEGYGEVPVRKVFYFKKHELYVEFKGFWTSNSGCQYNSHKEVRPVTKTITVYE